MCNCNCSICSDCDEDNVPNWEAWEAIKYSNLVSAIRILTLDA